MRDAIMKLEQCADYDTDLILANAQKVLNISAYDAMLYLICALQAKDTASVLYTIDKLYNSGMELKSFNELFIEFTLDLAKFAIFKDLTITNVPVYLEANVNTTIAQISDPSWYTELVDTLLQIKLETRYDSNYKSTIEAFLLRFCK
jgi:DNA polymerase III gamma/tau subunit